MKTIARLLVAMGALLACACASDSAVVGGYGYYDDYLYYGDGWYWNGCCVDAPDVIGPPHPEHPIAYPPGTRPENPIASPPRPSQPIASSPRPSQPITSPRPTAMPRAAVRGGGRR